jgi:antitoxin CcdA
VDESGKITRQIEIDAELLAHAEQAGLDLSDTVEHAIRRALSIRGRGPGDEERARRWREENAEAIAFNNAEIEQNGLWSDGLRLF